MKQFDYNKYRKNNPLLKEEMDSKTQKLLFKLSELYIGQLADIMDNLADEYESADYDTLRVPELMRALANECREAEKNVDSDDMDDYDMDDF